MEHEGVVNTSYIWCAQNNTQEPEEGTGGTETILTTENGQNTERGFWRPEETCHHSDSKERPSANAGVKNYWMQLISAKGTIKLGMAGWARWSTGNCARSFNSTKGKPESILHLNAQISQEFCDTNGSSNLPREPAKQWTLPFWLTTGQNWKKAKREINTWTLLENWKSYGTWRWWWLLLYLVRSVQSTKGLVQGPEVLWNKKTRGGYPNFSFVEIGQSTKKSLWDLRIRDVTQTLEENPQLTLVWNSLKRVEW